MQNTDGHPTPVSDVGSGRAHEWPGPVASTPLSSLFDAWRQTSQQALSEAVEWELVLSLYSETSSLLLGGFVLSLATVVSWMYTRQIVFLAGACAVICVTAGRYGLKLAFDRRREGLDRVRIWRTRFIIGAWTLCAVIGAVNVLLTSSIDPFVRLFMLSFEIVIVMAALMRNAGCPQATSGQVVLAFAPLLLACFLSGKRDFSVYALFIAFLIVGGVASTRHLYRQTVRLLQMNEYNSALVSQVQAANTSLAAANSRLEGIATTDFLTNIANRRRFDEMLGAEIRRAKRHASSLSLLLLDVDSFKGFNDLYGHQAGDECLRRIARSLSDVLRRPADLAARYGGEEFGAVLPETNGPAALQCAQEIRAAIEALAIVSAASATGVVTVSVGVATFDFRFWSTLEDFIDAADNALYAAKTAGRNCVRAARSSASDIACAAAQEAVV